MAEDDEIPTAADEPPPSNPWISGLALMGVVLVGAGAFCPIIREPSGTTRSYYDLPWVDGNIVLGAAIAAFVLTWVFRWYRGLFVTGGLALFILAATLVKLTRSEFRDDALSWGWLPLAAGALTIAGSGNCGGEGTSAKRRRGAGRPVRGLRMIRPRLF